MNLELLTRQVCNTCRAVGGYIHDELSNINKLDIKEKGVHDYVTYVDKNSEKRLITDLAKLLPEAGFIVEEGSVVKKAIEYNWVIDPLDGTTNFIHHIPIYSISVALMRKNEVILGVVYGVNNRECFYAWENSQAFLNRAPIRVSETLKLDDSLLATGFPYNDYSMLDKYLNLFKNLILKTRGIRRLGSAAIDLAYVACGRFDGFYEYGLHSWDVAAGAFIVQQAGGAVTSFNGGDDFIFGGEIIASNQGINDDLTNIISNSFA